MNNRLAKIANFWQDGIDSLPVEIVNIGRYYMYFLSFIYGLSAILAPVSEYCYIGSRQFFKLWQKLIFSVAFGGTSYGFFKLGNTLRTTEQKQKLHIVTRRAA